MRGELTQVSVGGSQDRWGTLNACGGSAPQRRRFGFSAAIQPAVQLRVACRMTCVCCRLPAAIAAARALPARALAPLSHMLKNGLRFVQGLAKPASFRFLPTPAAGTGTLGWTEGTISLHGRRLGSRGASTVAASFGAYVSDSQGRAVPLGPTDGRRFAAEPSATRPVCPVLWSPPW